LLGDDLIGTLAPTGDVIAFTFDAAYLARADRPVLGQAFEDRVLRVEEPFFGSRAHPLPSFFRNALPEGALRKVVEGRMGHSRFLELDMLLRLGPDLPGALRVVGDPLATGSARAPDDLLAHVPPLPASSPDPLRFSLSGVQLKASVDVELGGEATLTLPLVGAGGKWIAKFQSPAFRQLVENELAMLTWADVAGLDVPSIDSWTSRRSKTSRRSSRARGAPCSSNGSIERSREDAFIRRILPRSSRSSLRRRISFSDRRR
jgi:serine/threonine-protein kinase HipA